MCVMLYHGTVATWVWGLPCNNNITSADKVDDVVYRDTASLLWIQHKLGKNICDCQLCAARLTFLVSFQIESLLSKVASVGELTFVTEMCKASYLHGNETC